MIPMSGCCFRTLLRLISILGVAILSSSALTARADEPATVDQIEKLLDLRTAKLPDGAKAGGLRTLGVVMYEHKASVPAAFEFQKKQLGGAGWKELPGGYADDKNLSGHFTKDGFTVALSASSLDYDPMKAGWASVSVVNYGNMPASKFPTPAGVKPFYSSPAESSYVSEETVAKAAETCTKLLTADGWEQYGRASADPKSPMIHFKRNAILAMLWVQTSPGAGNKTLIRYSTEVLSADLPIPPGAPDADYNDSLKRVTFDWKGEDGQPVLDYYQKRLPAMGWKATTDKPITDDRDQSAFLIFRNAKKDLLSLDLHRFTGITRVELTHQTEAEVAEEEARAKAQAEEERIAKEKREAKAIVAIAVPSDAGEIETLSKNSFEFKVANGAGPSAFKIMREQMKKDGWTEKKGSKEDKHHGSVVFEKGTYEVGFSYFDTGIADAEVSVRGSTFVVFEPTRGKEAMGMPLKRAGKTIPIFGLDGPGIPEEVFTPKELEQMKKLGELLNKEMNKKPVPKRPPRKRASAG